MMKKISLCLGLFLLALGPRLFGLDVFITPDERRWIARSVLFFSAILRGDWAGTFQSGHPGVTTKWTGAIGLLGKYLLETRERPSLSGLQDFLDAVPVYPSISVEYLAPVRLPTVFLASLCVVVVYLLTRKLAGSEIALLGAFLLALDPFFLAHSRVIHHDALATIFMTVAVLSFTVYLWRGRAAPYLILSAVNAGLACLSKGPALFLGPYVGLSVVVACLSEGQGTKVQWGTVRRGLLILAAWGLLAALTFVLLWPLMWVDPRQALAGLINKSVGYAEEAHTKGNFFLGQAVDDPGLLFYPVNWLFRATPLTLIGVGAFVYAWVKGLLPPKGEGSNDLSRYHKVLMALTAYVLLFAAFMTLGDKKFDRYLLPVYPTVDILAATGLWSLTRWKMEGGRWKMEDGGLIAPNSQLPIPTLQPPISNFQLPTLVFAGCLVLQAGFSVPHYPYYLTAYNPLVGGGWLAPRVILVGWGEGLDGAARYLNDNDKAAALQVSSWYHRELMPFFVGEADRLDRKSDRNLMPWHMADYVVFYLNQVQRGNPDPALVQYISSLEPEQVIRLKGVDYAWIYPTPDYIPAEVVPAEHPQRAQFGQDLIFLGYDLDGSSVPTDGKVWTSLYWQGEHHLEASHRIYLKLINGAYHVWGEQDSRPGWDNYPTNTWPPGAVVKDTRQIEVLPGTPPGFYQLTIDVYDQDNGRWLPLQGGGNLVIGPVEIPRRSPPDLETLEVRHPLQADFEGKVRLLGYDFKSGFRAGDEIELTLFWQALAPLERRYTVFTHLVDRDGKLWGQKDNEPVDGFYPTTAWAVGEIVRDQYDLVIASDAPAGRYRLEVGMYLADTGERLETLTARGRDDKAVLAEVEIAGND